MTIVAFGYKAGVGKDTAADYLVSEYGFTKTAFAKNLKDCCMHVFGLSNDQVYDAELKQKELPTPISFDIWNYFYILDWMAKFIHKDLTNHKLALDCIGTKLKTPRDVLQFVGTEVMRAHCKDYHVSSCFSSMDDGLDYVITDVRFVNEAESVIEHGGVCINVVAPEQKMTAQNKAHSSEVDMDGWFGWSETLHNDKNGFYSFHRNIDAVMEKLNVRRQRS